MHIAEGPGSLRELETDDLCRCTASRAGQPRPVGIVGRGPQDWGISVHHARSVSAFPVVARNPSAQRPISTFLKKSTQSNAATRGPGAGIPGLPAPSSPPCLRACNFRTEHGAYLNCGAARMPSPLRRIAYAPRCPGLFRLVPGVFRLDRDVPTSHRPDVLEFWRFDFSTFQPVPAFFGLSRPFSGSGNGQGPPVGNRCHTLFRIFPDFSTLQREKSGPCHPDA